MSYIFLLDTRKCIGCGACAVACMDQNDVQPQEGDEPFRQCFVIEQGSGKDAPVRYLSMACMHCAQAPCVQGCPAGCLKKDTDTGFTVYDQTNCIGCHSCAMACPFAAPCFDRAGKMVKCDGCIERVRRGMQPACVRVCPYGALQLVEKETFGAGQRGKSARLLAYTALDVERTDSE